MTRTIHLFEKEKDPIETGYKVVWGILTTTVLINCAIGWYILNLLV